MSGHLLNKIHFFFLTFFSSCTFLVHVKSCWQQPFKICPLLFSRLIKHSRLWHIFSYYRLLTSSKQRLLSLRINRIHFKCQWIAVTRLKSSIWKRAWKNNHSLSPFYFFPLKKINHSLSPFDPIIILQRWSNNDPIILLSLHSIFFSILFFPPEFLCLMDFYYFFFASIWNMEFVLLAWISLVKLCLQ